MKNKIFDIICFVGGGFLFVMTLFNYSTYSRDGSGTPHYSEIQIILLALGIGLIILGFLIRSWRKGK